MATKLENIHKKTSDIVNEKKELTNKANINEQDRSLIKDILDDYFIDSDNISSISDLQSSLETDASDINDELSDNDTQRQDTLDDVDTYISALESNLSKLESINESTDITNSSQGVDSTKKRLTELEMIRSMLDEEYNGSFVENDNSNDSDSSFNEQRNAFLESIKFNVEPVKLNTKENVIADINEASYEELACIIKNNQLSKTVDFGSLDILVARQMVQSLYQTKLEFDFLSLNFIGSIQARNKRIENTLTKAYMEAYKKANPDLSEEALAPYVRDAVDKDLRVFIPADNTMAQSIFVDTPRDGLTETAKTVNGISINESYGYDYDAFTRKKEHEVKIGHKPIGCDTVKATIDHELGHQIANHLNAERDSVIIQAYNTFSALSDIEKAQALSTYAKKNIGEFIAECWSEYNNNSSCRKLATIVGKRLKELNDPNIIDPRIKEKGFSR